MARIVPPLSLMPSKPKRRKIKTCRPRTVEAASPYVGFNLNSNVRFKLTPLGHQLHRADWERTARWYEGVSDGVPYPYPYTPPKVDKDGYTEDQLWQVMELYGPSFHMGADNPFDLTILLPTADLEATP